MLLGAQVPLNQPQPRATVTRYVNATFEARIHLPGAAAHVDVVPHDNFVVVTGSLAPRVRTDAEGKASTLVFTDQPCGVFGRDIPVSLTPGTEVRSAFIANYLPTSDIEYPSWSSSPPTKTATTTSSDTPSATPSPPAPTAPTMPMPPPPPPGANVLPA
jgi:hypothetical protein